MEKTEFEFQVSEKNPFLSESYIIYVHSKLRTDFQFGAQRMSKINKKNKNKGLLTCYLNFPIV